MELRQLKYFAKVAETLSFSEAARMLCVTQSTLSQQIKQLEQEFDTALLLRTVRRAYKRFKKCVVRYAQHRCYLFVRPDADRDFGVVYETLS